MNPKVTTLFLACDLSKRNVRKQLVYLSLAALPLMGCRAQAPIKAEIATRPLTFCNPLNLNYRFMKIDEGNGIREAADPVVVEYQGKYLLFASKSSGYWYSDNFVNWTQVIIPDSVLPIEDYAPAVFVHNDYLYYLGSGGGTGAIYRSNHPLEGVWEKAKELQIHWDPAFYLEGDNLYMYYGSSPKDPIYVETLNLHTLELKSEAVSCLNSHTEAYGWERPGAKNELTQRPYLEGAWMTRHKGNYYLQYATPGTEWKTYADGTYVGSSPTGPFRYMENSPVSYKPSGFIGGAGHGCLFQVDGNYWKAATNAISVRHMFERRISFFPAGFDKDGYLYTDTYLGDYPMFLPAPGKTSVRKRPDWMLLSYRKPVTASTTLTGYPATNLVDEDVRTAWVATGNGASEWVVTDLKQSASICAIQVNYDEYGATQKGLNPSLYQSYIIYASHDGKQWYAVADKSDKRADTPHDYIEFKQPFRARYIKWENTSYTVSGNVSLRELRVFGHGNGKAPQPIRHFTIERDTIDRCKARISWPAVKDADGYIVRYGIAKDKLWHHVQVFDDSEWMLSSLNRDTPYYFTIESFNANGITKTKEILRIE